MAQYFIEGATLTDMASAIREKEGSTALIDPAIYADRIRAITGSEDLSAELAEQDRLIAELEAILATKAAGDGNIKRYVYLLREGEDMQVVNMTDATGVVTPVAQAGSAYVYDLEYGKFYSVSYYKDGIPTTEGLYVAPETEKSNSVDNQYCPSYKTVDGAWAVGIDWTKPAKNIDELYVRDPYIILVDDIYILYCSNVISPVLGNAGYSAYVSADAENWIGPYDLTAASGANWDGYENFWTPVVVGNGFMGGNPNITPDNPYSNYFYMMATAREKKPASDTSDTKYYNGVIGFTALSPLGPFYVTSAKDSVSGIGYGKDGYFMTNIHAENIVSTHFWRNALPPDEGNLVAIYCQSNNKGGNSSKGSSPDIIYTRNISFDASGKLYFSSGAWELLNANDTTYDAETGLNVKWPETDLLCAPFMLPKQRITNHELMLFNAIHNGEKVIGQAHCTGGFGSEMYLWPTPLVKGNVGGACVYPSRTGKMMLAYHINDVADYDNGIVEHLKSIEVEFDGSAFALRVKE